LIFQIPPKAGFILPAYSATLRINRWTATYSDFTGQGYREADLSSKKAL